MLHHKQDLDYVHIYTSKMCLLLITKKYEGELDDKTTTSYIIEKKQHLKNSMLYKHTPEHTPFSKNIQQINNTKA